MKKIRFGLLAIAMLLLAVSFVSCGGERVSVNCTVSVEVDGEIYLDGYNYTVENKVDTPPTVLQAVCEVFTLVDYDYGVDDEGLSLTFVTVDGEEYVTGMSADGSYFGYWGCLIDGVEPKGRMGKNLVEEGQHIVVHFSKEYAE